MDHIISKENNLYSSRKYVKLLKAAFGICL